MVLQSDADATALTGADEQFIRDCAASPLPPGDEVVREGRALCDRVTLRQSAFLRHVGMSSEHEYKRACVQDGTIMYHAHIGMNDWAATARALQHLEAVAGQHGFTIDRAGVALDRRMGLPVEQRASWPAETGPLLVEDEDWRELADCARIQPHMGDFMIGQPAAVENTIHALRAGVTTIGNLSQYFTFEAPGWLDRAKTSVEPVKAIAILAGFRGRHAAFLSRGRFRSAVPGLRNGGGLGVPRELHRRGAARRQAQPLHRRPDHRSSAPAGWPPSAPSTSPTPRAP